MADGSVIIDTELDQSGLKKGLAGLGQTVATGITTAVAAAGAALAALGGYAIKVGSDFEAAMSNVAATMGTTTDQIKELTEKAKELGSTTSFSATEAAEGLNILAQSGLNANEQLATIGPTLSLAAAGEMQMSDAASYLTTTIKAMSLKVEDAGYIADFYAKGATLANTSTAQFGDAVSSAASIAGAYNQSLETVGTSLLALAEKGYQGSAAGMYLSRAMTDLYAPTANAKKALDEIGISIYDAEGKQRDFIDIVNDLNGAFASLTEEEKANYAGMIFTTAGLRAFNSIAGNSSEQLEALEANLVDCADAAERMAKTKLDNLKGDIVILKSAAEGFGIAFYEAINGVGEGTSILRGFVQEGTSIISDLTTAMNEGGFDGLVNALGDALSRAVTKIVEYIPIILNEGIHLVSSLVKGLTNSSDTIAEAATGIVASLIDGILSISSDLLTLGADLIIALCEGLAEHAGEIAQTLASGIADIGTKLAKYLPEIIKAGITLIKALAQGIIDALPTLIAAIPKILTALLEGLKEALPMLIECVGEVITGLVEALPELIGILLEALPEILQLIVDTIMAMIPVVIDVIIQVVMAIATALPQVITAITDVLPALITKLCDAIITLLPMMIKAGIQLFTALVGAMPTIITNIVGTLPSIIDGILGAIVNALPLLIQAGIDLLTSLVGALPEIITAIVAAIPPIINGIIDAVVEAIPLIIQAGIDLLISLIDALPEIITCIVGAIPVIIDGILSALMDAIPLIIDAGIKLITSLIGALPEIIGTIVGAIPQIIQGLIEAVVDAIPLLIQAGVDLLVSLVSNIPAIIAGIVKAIPDIISGMINAIIDFVPKMAETGLNLIKGLWNGIKDAGAWLWDKISGFFDGIIGKVKKFFGIGSPSKLFRDEVGKQLMLGLAGGISATGNEAVKATEEVANDIARVDFAAKEPKLVLGLKAEYKDYKEIGKDLMTNLADGIKDEGKKAEKAVREVAKKIGAVKLGVMKPKYDLEIDDDRLDYEKLLARMQNTAKARTARLGTEISLYRETEAYRKQIEREPDADDDRLRRKPEYVENNIIIDGKKTARIMTPYLAKELEWEGK